MDLRKEIEDHNRDADTDDRVKWLKLDTFVPIKDLSQILTA